MRGMGVTLDDVDVLVGELSDLAGPAPDDAVVRVGGLCGEIVTTAEPQVIASTRSRIQRLMGRLERSGTLDPELRGALRAEISSLGAALTATNMQRESQRRSDERSTLRTQILAELEGGARRPRNLADMFGVDPSQISRAFRDLADEGRIVRAAPPVGESDHRARWYGLARDDAHQSDLVGPRRKLAPA